MKQQIIFFFISLCSYTIIFSSESKKHILTSPQLEIMDNRVERAECTSCLCGITSTCILCTTSDPFCIGKFCCALALIFAGAVVVHQKQATCSTVNHHPPQIRKMIEDPKK